MLSARKKTNKSRPGQLPQLKQFLVVVIVVVLKRSNPIRHHHKFKPIHHHPHRLFWHPSVTASINNKWLMLHLD